MPLDAVAPPVELKVALGVLVHGAQRRHRRRVVVQARRLALARGLELRRVVRVARVEAADGGADVAAHARVEVRVLLLLLLLRGGRLPGAAAHGVGREPRAERRGQRNVEARRVRVGGAVPVGVGEGERGRVHDRGAPLVLVLEGEHRLLPRRAQPRDEACEALLGVEADLRGGRLGERVELVVERALRARADGARRARHLVAPPREALQLGEVARHPRRGVEVVDRAALQHRHRREARDLEAVAAQRAPHEDLRRDEHRLRPKEPPVLGAVEQRVPPPEDDLGVLPVGEPVAVVDALVVLARRQPQVRRVEQRERRVVVQPLELEPREHDPLVLLAAPLVLLVLRHHADAAALVVQLLQRVALRVAEDRAGGERQPLSDVGGATRELARPLALSRAREVVPVARRLERLPQVLHRRHPDHGDASKRPERPDRVDRVRDAFGRRSALERAREKDVGLEHLDHMVSDALATLWDGELEQASDTQRDGGLRGCRWRLLFGRCRPAVVHQWCGAPALAL